MDDAEPSGPMRAHETDRRALGRMAGSGAAGPSSSVEARIRAWLSGLVVFLAFSGGLTWSQPRPALALQFVQLWHLAVGCLVIVLGIVYLGVHLAQTLSSIWRPVQSTPRWPFVAVTVLVLALWRASGEKPNVETESVPLVLLLCVSLFALLLLVRALGASRAALLAIGLAGGAVILVVVAVATDQNAPLVLVTGVTACGCFAWVMARSTGRVSRTPGGLGGLAMLTCFVAALSGAGIGFGLMPYAEVLRLPLPWLVHVASSWIALILVVAHIRASRVRSQRQHGAPRRAYAWAKPLLRHGVPAFLIAVLAAAVPAVWGSSRAPSFRTDMASVVPMDVGFSELVPATCAACHPDVVDGWMHSSHAHAATNPVFTGLLRRLGEERGAEAQRVCLRCHAPHARDPAGTSFASVVESEGYQAGVHCVSCHRSRPVGNADGAFEVTPFGADSFQFWIDRPGVAAALERTFGGYRLVRNTLLTSRLDRHRERHRFATHEPESCQPCHVQTLAPSTHGRMTDTLQDPYGSWRSSPAARAGLRCTTCHMTLYVRRYGTPFRDHRFLAGSTYVASVARGAEGVDEVVTALAGTLPLPLDENTPPTERTLPHASRRDVGQGPLLVLETEREGDALVVRTMNSGRLGHEFPVGPTDLFQIWLSVRATDARGHEVLEIGTRGPEGAPRLGDQFLDAGGGVIRDHRLWAVHEVIDSGRIPVEGVHEVRVDGATLTCAEGETECHFQVEAAWNYRRLDPALIEAVTGTAAPELPIVQVGAVRTTVPGRAAPPRS